MNLGTNWGNGYTEYNRGWQNAGLAHKGKEVARTEGDIVIGYDKRHKAMIEEWADWYGYEIEWKDN